ncbi:MAG: hypothetical protein ACRD5L_02650 [Bryobacteraceae bacterium]
MLNWVGITLLHLHSLLLKRRHRLLFSPKRGNRPGSKGPNKEIIDAVVEMKRRSYSISNVFITAIGPTPD